jgi:hypothetical protein
MRSVLVLSLLLVGSVSLLGVAAAQPPDVWPPVQMCTGGIGVFAAPCEGWLCLDVGGDLGTPTCYPLAQ